MLEVIKMMLPFIRPYKKTVILSLICALPVSAIKAYQAYLVKDVFDKGFSPDATFNDALKLALIIVALGLINYPFRYWHFFGMRMVVDKATCLIRHRIYKKLQNLSASYFSGTKQGSLLSVMINDTAMFAEAFMSSLDVIREPLTAIFLISVAIYHDWQLALVIFLAAPLFIIIFNVTGKRIRRYVAKAQEDKAEMTHHAAEGLIGQKIIKAFNLQDYIISRFDKEQDRFIKHKTKSNSAEEHSHPLVEVVGAMAFAGIIIFAHHRITSGELTTGGFVSFVAAIAMFMEPVRRFSKANAKLNQARAAAARIFRVLDEKEEEDTGKLTLESFQNQIEIKDMSFSYGENKVIDGLSFSIKKGEKVALVGLSGSGKSTLINLLLRLYNVESGEILIDGKNIQDYRLKSLREQFALVSQDIFLFNDTVRENLKAGIEYSEEEINRALEVSYASEYIKNLPEGLETPIGDRGLKLSGGQAQRLTIARAFLRDCDILLFDEATSALDNESEKIVQKALDQVASHKTVIAVAHRLSTIQNYDKIIVMKEGKKVQEGSHSELMSVEGEYKKLYELSQSE